MRTLPAPLGVDFPTLLRRVAKTAGVVAAVVVVALPFVPARVDTPVVVVNLAVPELVQPQRGPAPPTRQRPKDWDEPSLPRPCVELE